MIQNINQGKLFAYIDNAQALVWFTQSQYAVNEGGRLVLVAMHHETKRLKGKPAVFGDPVAQHRCPRVSITSVEEQAWLFMQKSERIKHDVINSKI